MNNNQKFIGGLILGAAAGAALALFLNSEKGKEAITSVKKAANNFGNDFKDKIEDLDDELDMLIAKGKAYIEELEQRKATQNNA